MAHKLHLQQTRALTSTDTRFDITRVSLLTYSDNLQFKLQQVTEQRLETRD